MCRNIESEVIRYENQKDGGTENFIVNKDYYTENELLSMARKIIFCINEVFDIRYITNIEQVKDSCFRIFADMCKDVKVVYNNTSGCYDTVVITNDNQLIYICL